MACPDSHISFLLQFWLVADAHSKSDSKSSFKLSFKLSSKLESLLRLLAPALFMRLNRASL